jgi:CubicO group peptidase (beta-lactamase class C family)
MRHVKWVIMVVVAAAGTIPLPADQPEPSPAARKLAGLWRAKRHFGPKVQGPLLIERRGETWTAEIMARTAPVRRQDDRLSFKLADGQGSFRGRLKHGRIVGHWIQPSMAASGAAYASAVTLEERSPGRYRGVVTPLDIDMTFYLPIKLNEDGTLTAFLRNPERNAGRFMNIERVTVNGSKVKLLGRRSKAGPETVTAEGAYDPANERFSLYLARSGGRFEFARASAQDEPGFFPRGRAPAPYAYQPPPAADDGWPAASLEDVGVSRDAITRFVQTLIDTPIDSVHASEIHGVLIARHGKLVLEEYFHGFRRDMLHDTRSASKSLTSALTGAALLQGYPIAASTPVYVAMGRTGEDADAGKRAITVENLLTMSSGLDCDDSNPSSRGNEDTMQDQTAQPDWYRYTLDLKLVRAPGEKAVYGSANPNLLGGVLGRTTGRWLPELVQDLIAEPLQIRRYAINLTPTGDAYMGGGGRFLPRDFMKLGQMMVDGGRWHDRPIVGAEWVRKSTSPLFDLNGIHYGYLWWVVDYPYKDRKVRAFFAGGNGGQLVMGIPDLDLVIAFYGGNYSDRVSYVPQQVYVPKYILPAVN